MFSKEEQAAMKTISEYYDCRVSLKKTVSTIDEEELGYRLKLEEREMNQFYKTSNMAANVSSWFFLNALGDKGDRISNLTVSYHFNTQLIEVETDVRAIQLARSMNPRLSEIDSIFKTCHYDQLLPMFGSTIYKESSKEKLLSSFAELDSQYGKVEEQLITGLEFISPNNDSTKTWIRFYGNAKRGGKFRSFTIVFDPYEAIAPIIGFSFK